jgi:hypothetical protein
MKSGRGQLILFVAAALAGVPAAAAEKTVATEDGRVALTFDDASWNGALDGDKLPTLGCKAEGCGGNTSGCGTVLVQHEGEPLSRDSFENGFRENLGPSAVDSANQNGGSDAAIVSEAAVTTHGSNTGVGLSLRVVFEGQPTRVDYFWLQSGRDLVGFTCLVAEDRYESAADAFKDVFTRAAVASEGSSQ